MADKFTVLLLYPDHLSDSNETFLAHVEGASIDEAVGNARAEALVSNSVEDVDPVDFKLLFAAVGYVNDISCFAKEAR